jgi:ABC-type phosphate/phosphonate transport system substrate-binding protein
VLDYTCQTPGLPFITRGTLSKEEVSELRMALKETLADPSPEMESVRDTLFLSGDLVSVEDDYNVLLQMEFEAIGKNLLEAE